MAILRIIRGNGFLALIVLLGGLIVSASCELKFGDSCSWEGEDVRRDYFKLIKLGRDSNYSQSANLELELANELGGLEEGDDMLCPMEWNLVCDKESSKCVCGNTELEELDGVHRSAFTLDAAEGNCVLSGGMEELMLKQRPRRSPGLKKEVKKKVASKFGSKKKKSGSPRPGLNFACYPLMISGMAVFLLQ